MMNNVIRVALGITTITCVFCLYLVNDYRGRLKAQELSGPSLEEAAQEASGKQPVDSGTPNTKLEKELRLYKRQSVQLINQVNRAVESEKVALATLKETTQRLKDTINKLALMTTERDGYKEVAKTLDQLEQDLTAYQALGTLAQLRGLKDQVNNIEPTPSGVAGGTSSTKGEAHVRVKPGTEVGMILSVDSKLGFCVINCGSAKGIVKDDEFHIHRGNKFVGKIKIGEVRPAVSIALAIKEFTPKELRAGDKVIQGD